MKKIKLTAIALAAIVAAGLIFLAAATMLLPQLLDKSSLGDKARREISSRIEGDFSFDRFDIAVFPSPHAILIKPRLSIPERFTASVETIELYPDIISSLTGQFSINKVAFKQPEATLSIFKSSTQADRAHLDLEHSTIPRSLLKVLSRLPFIEQGTVSQGRIKIVYNRTTEVTFDELDAVLKNVAGSFSVEATAASELVKTISLKATMQHPQVDGSAHINLGRLNLSAVNTVLAPDSSMHVADGTADIDLSLAVHEAGNSILDFDCSAPQIRLLTAGQKIDLEALKLAGKADMGASATDIAISAFQLGNPAMRLAGSVKIAKARPKISFDLTGQDINIGSTRSVTGMMAGSTPIVKTIFDILKDGTIPSITLSGRADAPRDLADLDTLVLHSRLSNGKVFIPGADLELTDVAGHVDLSKGVLTGQNVVAHWQQSRLQEGKFEIDLSKDPLPISVDSQTNLQAADVKKILEKFITDETFSKVLAQIDDLGGSATGTLTLSGNTDRLDVAASAAAHNIRVRHHSLPVPLTISDGAISYDNGQIQVKNLSGSLGTSAFAGLSGSIDLGASKTFSISSGTSRIVIKDMLPWLSSYQAISRITRYYGGGETIMRLTEIQSRGSLDDISHVHFNLTGDLQDLTIKNLPAQPGPLTISSMRLTADPETLSFKDVQAALLDGSGHISGKYADYRNKKPKGISLSFDGRAGPQLIGWISDIANLPRWQKLQPLTFRKSHFSYAHQEGQEIRAALALQDDLELTTELSIAQGAITVNSFKVQDPFSKVSLTAQKTGKLIDVAFEGTIHDSTLKKITHLPMVQSGSIDGKAKISLNVENLTDFKIIGDLNGKQIALLTPPEVPVILKNISLRGSPESINIASANLSWDSASGSLTGNIIPRAGSAPKFALHFEADTINADTMAKTFAGRKHGPGTAKAPQSLFSLLDGEVSFKANSLTLFGYPVKQLAADVRFSNDTADATLKKAVFCGIPLSGTATLAQRQFSFHAVPTVQSQKLDSTLDCLFDKQFKADGIVEFSGSFDGRGAVKDLAAATTGQAEIHITDGHIYHDIVMLNLLKFLNAVQVLTGQVTAGNMMEKGVGFDRFEAQVKLRNGTLTFSKFILDGEELKLGGSGHMDILDKHLGFTLLVAPLKTSSTVLEHIPLIGGLLETLDTIPLELTGTFDDVHFLPLAPSAVENELIDIMHDTVDIPLNLVHLNSFTGTKKR